MPGRPLLSIAPLALALLLLLALPCSAMRVREAPEYAVKAAYLLLFTRYVEWPSSAFALPTSPIEILIVGDDPFGDALEETFAGAASQGRPLIVRRADKLSSDARPHVLFFGGAESGLHELWLSDVEGAPMLTVSEDTSAVKGRTVLTFVTEVRRGEARIRFDVNLPSMQRAKLRINSQMLASARKVVREAPVGAAETGL